MDHFKLLVAAMRIMAQDDEFGFTNMPVPAGLTAEEAAEWEEAKRHAWYAENPQGGASCSTGVPFMPPKSRKKWTAASAALFEAANAAGIDTHSSNWDGRADIPPTPDNLKALAGPHNFTINPDGSLTPCVTS